MTLKPGWSEDEAGLWYSRPGGGQRTRGRWATCQICAAAFPAQLRAPGKYCSKQCLGRATGGSNRNSRPDLFVHWTPEECWLAGLLWADGCLSVDRNKRAVLLNITDLDAAQHAARIIGCRFGTYQPHSTSPGRKPVHRMRFGTRDTVDRFAAIGFDQPKLTTRPFPQLPHPASFLRGLFDGDGSVLWHRQGGSRATDASPLRLYTQLCGSVPCLEGVQDFLGSGGITPKKILRNGPSIWKVAWNHKDSLKLAAVMYSESGPCIGRKRAIYEEH